MSDSPYSTVRPTGERKLRDTLRRESDQAKEKRHKLEKGLPHLFGWKWYAWAKAFFDSTNRMNLLCAANQISKSSSQIRKCIHWSTCVKLWPRLWASTPRQFWYLYPNKDVATAEWFNKWLPEFMPAHEFKDHPIYGWQVEFDKRKIHSVHFNSGVIIYFKTYAQDVHSLQAGTCHAIFCDEELPEELYDELKARLFASDGHFHMVFTATRNQVMWLRAIEGKGTEELFPDAFKLQVSMYDCQHFNDGSPGVFNEEKIERAIAGCKNKIEVLRRIFGKFVRESGRVISEFDPLRHFKAPIAIPKDWLWWGGIDNGSGGDAHPGAYTLVAVRPDFRMGYVARGWKGTEDVDTTAGDVLDKYILGRAELRPVQQVYDYSSKDLNTMAERMGESLTRAEKSHDIGEQILDTLFKNNMLYVFDIPELRKLGTEFMTVMKETAKKHRKDDLMDTVRYICAAIPWDWGALQGQLNEEEKEKIKAEKPWTEADQVAWEITQRRGETRRRPAEEGADEEFEGEVDYWNEQYG